MAATLAAADAAPEQIRETWLRSAASYEQAGAPDEAAMSRANAAHPPGPSGEPDRDAA
ncbi:hypothetical protein ACFT7S_34670 [Streptomyces sp. NPDC057136]|uniref:hypothetical protein n=1 Tax=Streptomyces sp. NPDC057136 TaxID=3346029 RepID=UPI00363BC9D8